MVQDIICSQKPATGPYPEPAESSSIDLHLPKVHLNIIFPPTPRSSRTADKGLSSSFGVGEGLTTPHCKKVICYEIFQSASSLNVFTIIIFGGE